MASSHPERYRQLIAKLRQARRDAGLTQVDVAQRLNKPQQFVSRVELGERRLDPIELAELAKLYGKALTFFLDRSPGVVAEPIDEKSWNDPESS
jgi:transcriptional regulator with XRE-family HTH domain